MTNENKAENKKEGKETIKGMLENCAGSEYLSSRDKRNIKSYTDALQAIYDRALEDYDHYCAKHIDLHERYRAIKADAGYISRFARRHILPCRGTLDEMIKQVALAELHKNKKCGTGKETRADEAKRGHFAALTRKYHAHCAQWGDYAPSRLTVYNTHIYRNRAYYEYYNCDNKIVRGSTRLFLRRDGKRYCNVSAKLLCVDDISWTGISLSSALQSLRRRDVADWGRDKIGIYITLDGNDKYHLRRVADINDAIITLRRRANERRMVERNANLDTIIAQRGYAILVSIDDSVKSGNCPMGTEKFREHVKTEYQYDAQVISADLLLAIRDDEFTRRAARWALLNQKVA